MSKTVRNYMRQNADAIARRNAETFVLIAVDAVAHDLAQHVVGIPRGNVHDGIAHLYRCHVEGVDSA